MIVEAVQSVELLGEHLIRHYDEEKQALQLKLDTLRIVFTELSRGVPEELEFKLSKIVSYFVKNGQVNRLVHKTLGDLEVPNSYFRWFEFQNVDISVVDSKKYPFTVSIRSKYSLTEIKQWNENLRSGA